jgi:hypothetical protein
LWLSDTLRLGPPSRQYETALIGPRVILVDAEVEGVDQLDAASAFDVMLRELAVFLSVVKGEVRVSRDGVAVWTWTADSTGKVDCDMRNLGYHEPNRRLLPTKGQAQLVPLKPVQRPDFSLQGISVEETQQWLPADITDLWQLLTTLPPDRRRQFFQVGSMWQLALSLGHEYQTAGFTAMVTSCEALKPPDLQFRDHNIYHVVEALLGKGRADMLQEEWFRPQAIRNAHLHRGEFRGSEFARHVMISSFRDPTFDQAWRVLAQITRATIIEWLRRGGTFTTLPLKRRRSWRRWMREHTLSVLVVGVAIGFVSGWLLRNVLAHAMK